MALPTQEQARALLDSYVSDPYQRHHGRMVGTVLAGYAREYGEDEDLWYITGLLHDIDFEKHPDLHPAESLRWFRDWDYPEELVHAVEAHAYGYNGFKTLPQTRLAAALMATDELCGIFYAYKMINPIPYSDMKVGSIKKRYSEPRFAAKIDRKVIERGTEAFGVNLEDHIANTLKFLAEAETR